MLQITIPAGEDFDEATSMFIPYKEQHLTLEHSLVSLSKWESKWEKPFLDTEKTPEELYDYIRCMSINPVDMQTIKHLSNENIIEVKNYIDAKMSATWFRETHQPGGRRIVTAEVIYYWMVALNIPFECQKWHLNRLLTLIRVCNEENKPKKNMSKAEIARQTRELNAARRKRLHTRG